MFRGADIEVAIVVEGGIVDGYMILESTQVVTGIGYTSRAIVIIDDAIHADDEHGLRAMLDEFHRAPYGDLKSLRCTLPCCSMNRVKVDR